MTDAGPGGALAGKPASSSAPSAPIRNKVRLPGIAVSILASFLLAIVAIGSFGIAVLPLLADRRPGPISPGEQAAWVGMKVFGLALLLFSVACGLGVIGLLGNAVFQAAASVIRAVRKGKIST